MLKIILKNGLKYSSEDVQLSDEEITARLKEDFFFVETNEGSFYFAKSEIRKIENLSKNRLDKRNIKFLGGIKNGN